MILGTPIHYSRQMGLHFPLEIYIWKYQCLSEQCPQLHMTPVAFFMFYTLKYIYIYSYIFTHKHLVPSLHIAIAKDINMYYIAFMKDIIKYQIVKT